MKKFLIWLFEKYAFDYWVDLQSEKEKERIMKENNLKTEEDFIDWHRDKTQEPLRKAYNAGREDGYEKAMKANGGNIY